MANTVTIGRLTFTSPGELSFSGSTNQVNNSVSISGKLAVDDLDDAKSLRDEIRRVSPDVDLTYTGTDGEEDVTVPISINFFWPDA